MTSEAFALVRTIVKEQFKAQDAALLILWLLTHFTDQGALRSPQAARRKSIVLDGVSYMLVQVEKAEPQPKTRPS